MASRLLAAGWMALAALQTLAQDVTVLPIEWADPANPDDTLPVQTAPLAPKFPTELKQTTQIGWVEVDSFLDAQGEICGRKVQGTLPYFEDAAEAACTKARYAPAKYAGKRTGGRIQQVFLFNPASAALNGPDATPRLLRAGMIADPVRNPLSEEMRPSPEVVWVLAQIDAAGHVTAVNGASPRLNKLIDEGIRDWRFAPARRGGSAVAAEIRVPVILVAPGGLVAKGVRPVRVLTRASVRYPYEANRRGISGEVVLEFVVDPKGDIRDITVIRATLDIFAIAAREAIAQWRFEPAHMNGVPIASRVRQVIGFHLSNDSGGGEEEDSRSGGPGVKVTQKGKLSKLPENLRYDIAPKVRQLVQPKYPYGLLKAGAKGVAQVVVVIGPDGKVMVSKVLRADRPEFGYALQAAADRSQYQPAIKDGDPSTAMIQVEEEFYPRAKSSLLLSAADEEALKLERRHPESIVGASKLDGKLRPLSISPPSYPRSLEKAEKGEAVVEFLVSEEGEPLLPRVVSATRPEFGFAAVQGVANWRFQPPTSKGKPVIVRVKVPITFDPPAGYPNEQRISVP